MTTSGTYTFTVTRDDIIRQALLTIGKLAGNEYPKASDTQDCARLLNMMVKQWMGKGDYAPGLKVWTRKRGHLFLLNTTGQYSVGPTAVGWTNSYVKPTLASAIAVAGTSFSVSDATGIAAASNIGVVMSDGSLVWNVVSTVVGTLITVLTPYTKIAPVGAQAFSYVTAAQQPVTIETAVLRDIDNSDTPLRMLTVQDYDMVSNKADPNNMGDPGAIYYEFQLGNSNMFVDVGACQDVTKHIVVTYMEPVQDFVNPLDTPYYPQEWYLPLVLGLGKQAAPMYNKVWSALMQDNFKDALAIAQKKDPERITIFFQPGAED